MTSGSAVLSEQLLGLQDEFDMSNFPGRLKFFLCIVNPKHMLTSAAEIAAAKHTVLEHHRISELREARLAQRKAEAGAGPADASSSSGGGGPAARSGLWAWGWQSARYYVGLDVAGPGSHHAANTSDIDADTAAAAAAAAEAEALVRSCRDLSQPSAADAADARWTLAGTVHPKSGEAIALPFRMAAWPWFGAVPVSGLMYLARYRPTDLGMSAAGQWWNQSQNGLTNFCNGAAANGGEEATAVFVQGYAGAVGAAMVLALGAGVLAKQRFMAPFKSVIQFLPFPAVAGANVINTYLLRRHEIVAGIDVVDEDGAVVGQSVVAAKAAIRKTCVTRVVIPAGNFVIAPLVLMPFANTLSATRWLRYPVCFGVTLAVFGAWLPVSLALYPQRCELDVAELEPELAAKAKGSVVVYNKGL